MWNVPCDGKRCRCANMWRQMTLSSYCSSHQTGKTRQRSPHEWKAMSSSTFSFDLMIIKSHNIKYIISIHFEKRMKLLLEWWHWMQHLLLAAYSADDEHSGPPHSWIVQLILPPCDWIIWNHWKIYYISICVNYFLKYMYTSWQMQATQWRASRCPSLGYQTSPTA